MAWEFSRSLSSLLVVGAFVQCFSQGYVIANEVDEGASPRGDGCAGDEEKNLISLLSFLARPVSSREALSGAFYSAKHLGCVRLLCIPV